MFNGKKFEIWKIEMEDIIMDQEQWDTIDPESTPTCMLKEY